MDRPKVCSWQRWVSKTRRDIAERRLSEPKNRPTCISVIAGCMHRVFVPLLANPPPHALKHFQSEVARIGWFWAVFCRWAPRLGHLIFWCRQMSMRRWRGKKSKNWQDRRGGQPMVVCWSDGGDHPLWTHSYMHGWMIARTGKDRGKKSNPDNLRFFPLRKGKLSQYRVEGVDPVLQKIPRPHVPSTYNIVPKPPGPPGMMGWPSVKSDFSHDSSISACRLLPHQWQLHLADCVFTHQCMNGSTFQSITQMWIMIDSWWLLQVCDLLFYVMFHFIDSFPIACDNKLLGVVMTRGQTHLDEALRLTVSHYLSNIMTPYTLRFNKMKHHVFNSRNISMVSPRKYENMTPQFFEPLYRVVPSRRSEG